MALQTPTPTSSDVNVTATGMPSGSPDPNPPDSADLNTKNSVPFSFLIAFLALFVVFMGMGLWARRIVFYARRRMGLPVPEPPQKQRDVKSRKPVLWDVYPDMRKQPDRWHAIVPLSTWYCREAPPPTPVYESVPIIDHGWPPNPPITHAFARGPARSIPLAPIPSPSSSTRRSSRRQRLLPLQSLREWWLDLINPMRHAPHKGMGDGKGKVDALQVAVFVSMPSQPGAKSRGLDQLGEMSIGIAGTPWGHDDSVLEVHETRT